MTHNYCTTCGNPATKKCGKCGRAWYCSRDCQRQDWKNHKRSCNPFEIKDSDGKGLGLFATCDLEIGDLIVREEPILYFEGGAGKIMGNPERFKDAYEELGREEQDRILALTGANSDPTLWNTVITGLSLGTSTEDEEWRKGLRIFGRNCIVVYPDVDKAQHDSALYTTIARINHCCSPNAEWSYMEENREVKEVRAIKRIKKGEEVVADYISDGEFRTASERKKELSLKWNFDCACSMCTSDHTENDALRRKLQQLHNDVPYYARQLDLQSAVAAALEKCQILENCEDLVTELPMAYLELYETVVGAKQYTEMLGLRPLPILRERYEDYRERAFELMKKTKLATDKEGYNKKMVGLARRHGCFKELME